MIDVTQNRSVPIQSAVRARMARARLDEQQAATLGAAIADTLSYVHSRGVILSSGSSSRTDWT